MNTPNDFDPDDDPFALSEPVADAPRSPTQTPGCPPASPSPPAGVQHTGFICVACGYDLTGAVIGGQCPECGTHINPQALTRNATNAMAITSMVLGICSLALCIFYGIFTIILAPMGIIFGHIARAQIRSGRYSPGSAGFALTGLICSYIGLGLVAAVVLSIVLFSML